MNAVIIEPDGSWTLRGHRLAAEGLDVTLLAEPDAVIAYLRRWEERDWWYDEIWAEGGIVVDASTRELAFFGGCELVRTIPMRRRYLDVLGAVWAGWRVRWAWRRTADILGAIGLAAHPAGGAARPPVEWDPRRRRYPSAPGHLLSCAQRARRCRDLAPALGTAPGGAGSAGGRPGCLDRGRARPGQADLARSGDLGRWRARGPAHPGADVLEHRWHGVAGSR
jgi:hypothetical protein